MASGVAAFMASNNGAAAAMAYEKQQRKQAWQHARSSGSISAAASKA